MKTLGPIFGIIGGIVAVVVALSAAFTVRENEQALILEFGKPLRVLNEPGLHFKIPIIQRAEFFDKRVLDYDATAQEVPTKDQKQLVVDSFTRYRIVNPLLYRQNTQGLESRMNGLLDVRINEALRDILGEVQLSVVLTPERARLVEDFTRRVARSATQYGIEVIDVRIKRIDLPSENSQAIFRRMQTQREQEARKIRAEGDKESRRIRAEADKNQRVVLAEARKQAEILRGEGDALAQRVYNEAYGKDPEFFDFWRSMQAMRRGLASETTTYVGPPDGDFFRFFGEEQTQP